MSDHDERARQYADAVTRGISAALASMLAGLAVVALVLVGVVSLALWAGWL